MILRLRETTENIVVKYGFLISIIFGYIFAVLLNPQSAIGVLSLFVIGSSF